MIRRIYIATVILYIVIIGLWCFRYPISYSLTTGIDTDLIVKNRSLTPIEYRSLDKAYQIRGTISTDLLYSSLALSISSFFIIRRNILQPTPVVKPMMYLSAAITIIIVVVNSIGFVPHAPVR